MIIVHIRGVDLFEQDFMVYNIGGHVISGRAELKYTYISSIPHLLIADNPLLEILIS